MNPIITLLFGTILCLGCNQQEPKKISTTLAPVNAADNYSPATTILMLDERLNEVDSLVYVFYKDPLGKDSLRYTRYYTQHSSTDLKDIAAIKKQVSKPTKRLEKVRKCRSQGKVWCFSKGAIFQTLYFSDFGGTCSFLFFIKNGQFYYSDLDEAFRDTVLKNKAVSR